MYKDDPHEEYIKGLKIWKNPKNLFQIVMLHYSADPAKDPERDGKEWYNLERRGTPLASWNKEMEIDFTTKSGKLIFGPDFCDFNKKVHFIKSFEFQEPTEHLISLDFGQRNPTCALIGIWTEKNVLYIVDEYYKAALPSVSSKDMFEQFDYLFPYSLKEKTLREKRLAVYNQFQIRVIDPSTAAKNRTKKISGEEVEYSIIEEFDDNSWDFEPGSKDVSASINRIREYLQVDEDGKSHIYIFEDKCPNLCWELAHYKYKEYSEIQEKTRNDSEEPVKKDDHSVDALRYMIMTRPNAPMRIPPPLTRIQKDIRDLTKPKVWDHRWDIDD